MILDKLFFLFFTFNNDQHIMNWYYRSAVLNMNNALSYNLYYNNKQLAICVQVSGNHNNMCEIGKQSMKVSIYIYT